MLKLFIAISFLAACGNPVTVRMTEPNVKGANTDSVLEAQKDELIAVAHKDGSLTINDKLAPFSKKFQTYYQCPEAPAELRIESFDDSTLAIYYRAHDCEGSNDPPDGHVVFFIKDGKPMNIFEEIGGKTVKFPGNGSVTSIESGYQACSRANPDWKGPGDVIDVATVVLKNRIWQYDSAKKILVVADHKDTEEFDCNIF